MQAQTRHYFRALLLSIFFLWKRDLSSLPCLDRQAFSRQARRHVYDVTSNFSRWSVGRHCKLRVTWGRITEPAADRAVCCLGNAPHHQMDAAIPPGPTVPAESGFRFCQCSQEVSWYGTTGIKTSYPVLQSPAMLKQQQNFSIVCILGIFMFLFCYAFNLLCIVKRVSYYNLIIHWRMENDQPLTK